MKKSTKSVTNNPAIAIVRALQAKKKADQALAAAQLVRSNDRCAAAFAPVFDFLTSVMELPAKHWRWHCGRQLIPLKDHFYNRSKTFVSFYSGDGSSGFGVWVVERDGTVVFETSDHSSQTPRRITAELALEKVQTYVADRIVLPETEP